MVDGRFVSIYDTLVDPPEVFGYELLVNNGTAYMKNTTAFGLIKYSFSEVFLHEALTWSRFSAFVFLATLASSRQGDTYVRDIQSERFSPSNQFFISY